MLTQWRIIALKFLRDKNTKSLRSQFVDIWEDAPPEDKRDIFHFLFQAKQWKFFAELFLAELRAGNPYLPWEHLLSIFQQSSLNFPEVQRKTLHKHLKKSKITTEEFQNFEEATHSILLKKKYNFLQAIQNKKQELLTSAKIAQSERLFDQQMSYLNELKALFPEDINIRENIYQKERTEAEKILNRAQRFLKDENPAKDKRLKEEQPLVEQIKQQADQWVEKNPKASKDIAIMFRQFGYVQQGVDFLEKIEASEQKDWLLIDFLFSAEQYITLLSHCDSLKVKYAKHPELLFSVSYIEALTYWELDERQKAIHLMQQIAQMKPDFKSATELLFHWQEEVN